MTYEEWAATNPESAIVGKGWASDHLWHLEGTPTRTTYYKCARCFWNFGHHYPSEPNIFKALKASGVPDKCPRQQMWPIRLEYASKEELAEWAFIRACADKGAIP